jgi:hypothetical protein
VTQDERAHDEALSRWADALGRRFKQEL